MNPRSQGRDVNQPSALNHFFFTDVSTCFYPQMLCICCLIMLNLHATQKPPRTQPFRWGFQLPLAQWTSGAVFFSMEQLLPTLEWILNSCSSNCENLSLFDFFWGVTIYLYLITIQYPIVFPGTFVEGRSTVRFFANRRWCRIELRNRGLVAWDRLKNLATRGCQALFAKKPIAPVLVIKDHRAKVPCIDVHLHCSVFRTYMEAIGKSLAPEPLSWNGTTVTPLHKSIFSTTSFFWGD